ncbi:MAG: hypothetical protein WA227_23910 [Mycobacterium sp.]|uniref:hypothetical protein n=1 Tax=Mycobacterium sp. TaxID=1785 RepID=UPI003BB4ABC7
MNARIIVPGHRIPGPYAIPPRSPPTLRSLMWSAASPTNSALPELVRAQAALDG